MVILLYNNYLNDPKITDEERQEVITKAEEIFAKRRLANKAD